MRRFSHKIPWAHVSSARMRKLQLEQEMLVKKRQQAPFTASPANYWIHQYMCSKLAPKHAKLKVLRVQGASLARRQPPSRAPKRTDFDAFRRATACAVKGGRSKSHQTLQNSKSQKPILSRLKIPIAKAASPPTIPTHASQCLALASSHKTSHHTNTYPPHRFSSPSP